MFVCFLMASCLFAELLEKTNDVSPVQTTRSFLGLFCLWCVDTGKGTKRGLLEADAIINPKYVVMMDIVKYIQ